MTNLDLSLLETKDLLTELGRRNDALVVGMYRRTTTDAFDYEWFVEGDQMVLRGLATTLLNDVVNMEKKRVEEEEGT